MAEAIGRRVQYRTHKDLDDGAWTTVELKFATESGLMEYAQYMREAYVNVRIQTTITNTTTETIDGP